MEIEWIVVKPSMKVQCCFIDETLFSTGSSIYPPVTRTNQDLLQMDVLIGQVLDWNRGMDSKVVTGRVLILDVWVLVRYWENGYW